jgi:type IV pilus assembly protein PilM
MQNAKPRVNVKMVVSGLPESKVFTKVIQVPKMTDDELNTAIPFEAAKHIPVPQNELYLDFKNLGEMTKDVLDVLFVAAPKYLVENYIKVFHLADMDLIALETKPIAAARAIIHKNENQTILILDIGAEATGISIYDMESIRFTFTIPHGGNTLTNNIANTLKIPVDKAEKFKREIGLKKDDNSEVFAAMGQIMDDIIEEIKNAIKFYESRTKPARKIAEIRICGGGALTPNIAEYVKEKVEKPVNIANPLINLKQNSGKNIPSQDVLRLTTAIGLALREKY